MEMSLWKHILKCDEDIHSKSLANVDSWSKKIPVITQQAVQQKHVYIASVIIKLHMVI